MGGVIVHRDRRQIGYAQRPIGQAVVFEKPDVVGHNLETVRRLYPSVRPEADYARSLGVLSQVKKLGGGILTKSSLLLGMGERQEEVAEAVKDLKDAGCDIITFGQYLAPSGRHYPVKELITPGKFGYYRDLALSLGINNVFSGPKVRSSYRAQEVYNNIMNTHDSLLTAHDDFMRSKYA